MWCRKRYGMRSQSSPISRDPGDVPGSPRHRFRHRVRQFGGLLAATAVLVTGGVIAAGPASAASVGPGHGDLNTTGTVGAFIAESDGRQVYCMDAGAPAPWNMTSGPTTVTDLTSYTGQQLSPTTLAKLNYVMAKWGDSTNPDITAAVQMYVWAEADPVTYQAQGGQSWALARDTRRAPVDRVGKPRHDVCRRECESCGEPIRGCGDLDGRSIQRHPHRQCVTNGAEWERGAHGCDLHRRHHLKSTRNQHVPDRGETSRRCT